MKSLEQAKEKAFRRWIYSLQYNPGHARGYYTLYKSLERLQEERDLWGKAQELAKENEKKSQNLLNKLLALDRFLNLRKSR